MPKWCRLAKKSPGARAEPEEDVRRVGPLIQPPWPERLRVKRMGRFGNHRYGVGEAVSADQFALRGQVSLPPLGVISSILSGKRLSQENSQGKPTPERKAKLDTFYLESFGSDFLYS